RRRSGRRFGPCASRRAGDGAHPTCRAVPQPDPPATEGTIMNGIRRPRGALHGAMSSFEPLAEDIGEVLPPAPAHLPVEGPLSSQAPGPKPGSAQLTRLPERPEFRSPCARAYSKLLIGSELPDPTAQAPARHTAGRA